MDSGTRSELRKIGHPMRPLMRLGKAGLTEAFVGELGRALGVHQLVKVRLDASGKEACRARAEEVAAAVEARVVDVMGGSALLYREDPEDPLVPPA